MKASTAPSPPRSRKSKAPAGTAAPKAKAGRWSGLPEPPPPAPNRTRVPWSKEEERILRRNYARNGAKYTAALLGRTISGVHRRAENLGISSGTNRGWSEIEDKHLRRTYQTHTATHIARTLRRTEQSVRGRIHKLGLGEPGSSKWTAVEIEYLQENYGSIPLGEMALELGRSADAVQIKAGKLGLTRSVEQFDPSPAQMNHIVSNLGKIPFTVMARKFGVRVNTIRAIAERNGYRDRPQSREWSQEDLDRLRALFGTMTREELAIALDRTVVAVTHRAQMLGLTRKLASGQRRTWTAAEKAAVRRHHGKKTYAEIAELLGRSPHSVAAHAKKMGLVKPRVK